MNTFMLLFFSNSCLPVITLLSYSHNKYKEEFHNQKNNQIKKLISYINQEGTTCLTFLEVHTNKKK
jgi:hypothetical protein